MFDVNAGAKRARREVQQAQLDALDLEKQQRDDSVVGINALNKTGMPRSGYMGQSDYIIGKNREGEAAKLRASLYPKSGEYGVQHSYGGTDFAAGTGGGARPSMQGMKQASTVAPDQSDNLDYFSRREALEQQKTQNSRLREQAFQESTENDPYYADKRGNIAREQVVKDAKAAGEAGVAKYAAEQPIRWDKDWDDRARARDLGYTDPRIREAEITSAGKVASAQSDQQRERAAAFKAFADLAKTQSGIQPEIEEKVPGSGWFGTDIQAKKQRRPNPQWQVIQDAMDEARRSLGPNVNRPEAGGQSDQSLSQEELAAFAAENGMTPEQARALAVQHGYAIR